MPLENAIGATERMRRNKSWLFSSANLSGWEDGIVYMLGCVAWVIHVLVMVFFKTKRVFCWLRREVNEISSEKELYF